MKRNKIFGILSMVVIVGLIAAGCSVVEAPVEEAMSSLEEEQEIVDPENPEPLAAENKTRNPEEIFRFETTALYGEGGSTINPTGMLLNIGCEDCQDIFYASRSLTVEEVIQRLKDDFGIEEMLADENFVRFDLDLDLVRTLEIELDLIAAKKLENETEMVDIRIISIAPEE
ncbi:MAG: hypothetical protein JXN10_01455 [Clostridia bacterium]|nr:hypothetical protein [Clostridia bacterium]MBN2882168.1 hypothetical protein [Clostridia bacterium]